MPDNGHDYNRVEKVQKDHMNELLPLTGLLVFAAAVLLSAISGSRAEDGVSYSVDEAAASSVTAAEVRQEQALSAAAPEAENVVSSQEEASSAESVSAPDSVEAPPQPAAEAAVIIYPIDINRADLQQLIGVNGIGEVTASAVISYRESVGVIHCMEQLLEIDGIGDSTLELLCGNFYVSEEDYLPPPEDTAPDEAPTEKAQPEETEAEQTSEPAVMTMTDVNINTASAEEIAAALLLTEEQARAVVELRELIEYFSAPEELLYTEVITDEEYLRIRDHVLI